MRDRSWLGIKLTEADAYVSLVKPPAGYSVSSPEILSASHEDLTPEEEEVLEALGIDPDRVFLEGEILFRCVVHCPDGGLEYTSVVAESFAELCRKSFWKGYWRQVVKSTAK